MSDLTEERVREIVRDEAYRSEMVYYISAYPEAVIEMVRKHTSTDDVEKAYIESLAKSAQNVIDKRPKKRWWKL